MKLVDLSCDLGEAADPDQQRIEDSLWPLIHSANVACGGHAGDEATMRHAWTMARRYQVRLGAHPSYPDRQGFGRRTLKFVPEELEQSLFEQLTALLSLSEGAVQHVKPHGALYNDAHHDGDLARLVVGAISRTGSKLAMVASASSALWLAARQAGHPVIAEAFADRRYRRDGSLVPRSRPDALLLDPEDAAEQALRLARSGTVLCDDGTEIAVPFETLCVHADMEGAVERLKRIRSRLSGEGLLPS